MAALAGGSVADAGKKGKKTKKTCNQQKQQCRSAVQDWCEENQPGVEAGVDTFALCCTTCNLGTGVACLLEIFANT